MSQRSPLNPSNAPYLDDLYEAYTRDPASVSESWRQYFRSLDAGRASVTTPAAPEAASAAFVSELTDKQVRVQQLVSAIRYRGHREANLDPLELTRRPRLPDLDPAEYGLTEADMDRTFNTGNVFMQSEATLRDDVTVLR